MKIIIRLAELAGGLYLLEGKKKEQEVEKDVILRHNRSDGNRKECRGWPTAPLIYIGDPLFFSPLHRMEVPPL